MAHYFSTPTAIVLTLFAAAMWGSWMQIVKLKKDYPIMGIAFFLYIFSFILVWGVTLVLAPFLLPEGLRTAIGQHTDIMGKILLGGGMMSIGLFLSLTIMSDMGLLLGTTFSGAITSIMGIATSIYEEGLPQNALALPLIIITSVVFLLASFICSKASQMCEEDRQLAATGTVVKVKNKITLKAFLLIILQSFLANGWATGTAAGTAAGLQPILTCAFMATGSAISMVVIGLVVFTKKHMWKQVLCVGTSKKPLVLSALSSVCHYGGNILSIYSMPVISATLSFLFGKTSTVWTYFWGLFYKEFSGAQKRTVIMLTCGLALYFGGLVLLFFYNFG